GTHFVPYVTQETPWNWKSNVVVDMTSLFRNQLWTAVADVRRSTSHASCHAQKCDRSSEVALLRHECGQGFNSSSALCRP
ncbi:hypothetical protein BaRGS_00031982, partial [Batillaria attramentaria]